MREIKEKGKKYKDNVKGKGFTCHQFNMGHVQVCVAEIMLLMKNCANSNSLKSYVLFNFNIFMY
jgi:hypothetical protein